MMDFRGFDSSIILILRGGIPRPMGDFSENLTRTILVGVCNISRTIERTPAHAYMTAHVYAGTRVYANRGAHRMDMCNNLWQT